MKSESAASRSRRRDLGLALLLLVIASEFPAPAAAFSWPSFKPPDMTDLFGRIVGSYVVGSVKEWLFKAVRFVSSPVFRFFQSVKSAVWSANKWVVDSPFNPFEAVVRDWNELNAVFRLIHRLRKGGGSGELAQCWQSSWERCSDPKGWIGKLGALFKVEQTVYCAVEFVKDCRMLREFPELSKQQLKRRLAGEYRVRRAGPLWSNI